MGKEMNFFSLFFLIEKMQIYNADKLIQRMNLLVELLWPLISFFSHSIIIFSDKSLFLQSVPNTFRLKIYYSSSKNNIKF